MASRIITDISDFIFVEDTPEPADAIFLPAAPTPSSPNTPPPCTARDTGSGLSLPVASA